MFTLKKSQWSNLGGLNLINASKIKIFLSVFGSRPWAKSAFFHFIDIKKCLFLSFYSYLFWGVE